MSRNFYALFSLTKRGIKLFLKDRAGVFFSLLAPLIVLLLYVLFLADVQLQSLRSYLVDLPVSDELAGAFVDGWMLAGAVSVACITVPFSAQSIMIKDKETGSLADMLVSPVSRRIIQLSYLTAVLSCPRAFAWWCSRLLSCIWRLPAGICRRRTRLLLRDC